jgi:cation-dependent mannose-6-phosphate receptor
MPQSSTKSSGKNTNNNGNKEVSINSIADPVAAAAMSTAIGTASLEDLPCTATSHASGHFFDLRGLIRAYPADTTDWVVRGQDYYPANFTLNICAPLLLPLDHLLKSGSGMAGTDSDTLSTTALASAAANVSAVASYADGSVRSLGTVSTTPRFRGRNLVLEYTGGSPCLNPDGTSTQLRASTLISLKCSREDISTLSFVGSPDHCAYYFEARSIHACPAADETHSMAPVSMFLVILLVALAVYMAASFVLHPSMTWARLKASVKRPYLLLAHHNVNQRSSAGGKYTTHEYYRRSGPGGSAGNTRLYRDDKEPVNMLVVPMAGEDFAATSGQSTDNMV